MKKPTRFIDLDPNDFCLNIAQSGAIELVKNYVRVTNQSLLAYEPIHYSRLIEWADKCAGCGKSFEKSEKFPDCGMAIVVEIGVDEDRLYHADCRPALRWWHQVVEVPSQKEIIGEQILLF